MCREVLDFTETMHFLPSVGLLLALFSCSDGPAARKLICSTKT